MTTPDPKASLGGDDRAAGVNPDHAPKRLEGEAVAWPSDDPRYEIDVTYEVWQGDCLVAGATDFAEARRYEAMYQPCSLLLATTYRQPAHLPPAVAPIEAGLRETVARIIVEWPVATDHHSEALDLADAILAAQSSNRGSGK